MKVVHREIHPELCRGQQTFSLLKFGCYLLELRASIMVDDVKFNKYVEAMVDIHQIHASDTTRDRRANVEFT